MSAPPTLLPAADNSADVSGGQKRKLDALDAAADRDAKQVCSDVGSGGVAGVSAASAPAAYFNSPMLHGGICGLAPAVPAPTYVTPSVVAATSTPQSAAAFVAGAAAVTQALFQNKQQRGLIEGSSKVRGEGEGNTSTGGSISAGGEGGEIAATAASTGECTLSAGETAEGGNEILAADIARAAAAAAAAITARQSTANTAAKALQMALKTAEMLQGSVAGGTAATATAATALPEPSSQTRHARKVYVGNLPVPVTQTEVQQYFNELLDSLLPNKLPGQTIIHVYVNGARRFAFLEHRSIEEANFTIGLDGISWRNCCLSLRRPQDYNPALAEQQYQEERTRQGGFTGFAVPPPSVAAAKPAAAPHSALIVPDSPHKIFIGGLPHSITEQACKQLLEAFGQLRALHVVKDPQRGDCKGFAFCEYLDPNVTDVAVAGLNNMRIGDRVLQVRRAMPHGHLKGVGPDGSLISPPAMPSIVGTLSRVIAIHNMLPPLPLVPTLLRDAVATEARIRSAAYGDVVFVDVQEALATQAAAKGEGVPVLVEFKDVDTAIQAMSGIQGSTYDGRPLSVVFSEPSPAMKKAAVMRIVMEAGGSPVPMKLSPSPSPGNEVPQVTPAEPRGGGSEEHPDAKEENGEQDIEAQQRAGHQEQMERQEHHEKQPQAEQERGDERNAEGAPGKKAAGGVGQLKAEAKPEVTSGRKVVVPDGAAGEQQAEAAATASAGERVCPVGEGLGKGGAASVKIESEEKSCTSVCAPVACKFENGHKDARANAEESTDKQKAASQDHRTENTSGSGDNIQ